METVRVRGESATDSAGWDSVRDPSLHGCKRWKGWIFTSSGRGSGSGSGRGGRSGRGRGRGSGSVFPIRIKPPASAANRRGAVVRWYRCVRRVRGLRRERPPRLGWVRTVATCCLGYAFRDIVGAVFHVPRKFSDGGSTRRKKSARITVIFLTSMDGPSSSAATTTTSATSAKLCWRSVWRRIFWGRILRIRCWRKRSRNLNRLMAGKWGLPREGKRSLPFPDCHRLQRRLCG